MGFELQSGTMYIDGKPFEGIKECEITESSIDDQNIIGIDLAKSSDMTFDITDFNWTNYFKAIGLKWYQRTWIRIKWFFRDIVHKRRS